MSSPYHQGEEEESMGSADPSSSGAAWQTTSSASSNDEADNNEAHYGSWLPPDTDASVSASDFTENESYSLSMEPARSMTEAVLTTVDDAADEAFSLAEVISWTGGEAGTIEVISTIESIGVLESAQNTEVQTIESVEVCQSMEAVTGMVQAIESNIESDASSSEDESEISEDKSSDLKIVTSSAESTRAPRSFGVISMVESDEATNTVESDCSMELISTVFASSTGDLYSLGGLHSALGSSKNINETRAIEAERLDTRRTVHTLEASPTASQNNATESGPTQKALEVPGNAKSTNTVDISRFDGQASTGDETCEEVTPTDLHERYSGMHSNTAYFSNIKRKIETTQQKEADSIVGIGRMSLNVRNDDKAPCGNQNASVVQIQMDTVEGKRDPAETSMEELSSLAGELLSMDEGSSRHTAFVTMKKNEIISTVVEPCEVVSDTRVEDKVGDSGEYQLTNPVGSVNFDLPARMSVTDTVSAGVQITADSKANREASISGGDELSNNEDKSFGADMKKDVDLDDRAERRKRLGSLMQEHEQAQVYFDRLALVLVLSILVSMLWKSGVSYVLSIKSTPAIWEKPAAVSLALRNDTMPASPPKPTLAAAAVVVGRLNLTASAALEAKQNPLEATVSNKDLPLRARTSKQDLPQTSISGQYPPRTVTWQPKSLASSLKDKEELPRVSYWVRNSEDGFREVLYHRDVTAPCGYGILTFLVGPSTKHLWQIHAAEFTHQVVSQQCLGQAFYNASHVRNYPFDEERTTSVLTVPVVEDVALLNATARDAVYWTRISHQVLPPAPVEASIRRRKQVRQKSGEYVIIAPGRFYDADFLQALMDTVGGWRLEDLVEEEETTEAEHINQTMWKKRPQFHQRSNTKRHQKSCSQCK